MPALISSKFRPKVEAAAWQELLTLNGKDPLLSQFPEVMIFEYSGNDVEQIGSDSAFALFVVGVLATPDVGSVVV